MQLGQMATSQACFSWTLSQRSQPWQKQISQHDDGQESGRRSYTLDGELTVRPDGGDDHRGQRHGKTPSGDRGPARNTWVTNPRCDLHLSPQQVG
jgi:hypothetical protein